MQPPSLLASYAGVRTRSISIQTSAPASTSSLHSFDTSAMRPAAACSWLSGPASCAVSLIWSCRQPTGGSPQTALQPGNKVQQSAAASCVVSLFCPAVGVNRAPADKPCDPPFPSRLSSLPRHSKQQLPPHALPSFSYSSTHVAAVYRHEARHQGHQCVLVQPAKGAVKHHFGRQQLVCAWSGAQAAGRLGGRASSGAGQAADLAGRPPLQGRSALGNNKFAARFVFRPRQSGLSPAVSISQAARPLSVTLPSASMKPSLRSTAERCRLSCLKLQQFGGGRET